MEELADWYSLSVSAIRKIIYLKNVITNPNILMIGKFSSIACGAKFLFNSANHTLDSLSTYTFPLFFEEWGLPWDKMKDAWDHKGDIIIGNDVWNG